ncbi:hypothetical protein EDC01DRAFT_676881 [Geopyxis carbonaria]|nr:hypothetical protein EDC01DRAFT_676881 [Geopyxis carbonaria]
MTSTIPRRSLSLYWRHPQNAGSFSRAGTPWVVLQKHADHLQHTQHLQDQTLLHAQHFQKPQQPQPHTEQWAHGSSWRYEVRGGRVVRDEVQTWGAAPKKAEKAETAAKEKAEQEKGEEMRRIEEWAKEPLDAEIDLVSMQRKTAPQSESETAAIERFVAAAAADAVEQPKAEFLQPDISDVVAAPSPATTLAQDSPIAAAVMGQRAGAVRDAARDADLASLRANEQYIVRKPFDVRTRMHLPADESWRSVLAPEQFSALVKTDRLIKEANRAVKAVAAVVAQEKKQSTLDPEDFGWGGLERRRDVPRPVLDDTPVGDGVGRTGLKPVVREEAREGEFGWNGVERSAAPAAANVVAAAPASAPEPTVNATAATAEDHDWTGLDCHEHPTPSPTTSSSPILSTPTPTEDSAYLLLSHPVSSTVLSASLLLSPLPPSHTPQPPHSILRNLHTPAPFTAHLPALQAAGLRLVDGQGTYTIWRAPSKAAVEACIATVQAAQSKPEVGETVNADEVIESGAEYAAKRQWRQMKRRNRAEEPAAPAAVFAGPRVDQAEEAKAPGLGKRMFWAGAWVGGLTGALGFLGSTV